MDKIVKNEKQRKIGYKSPPPTGRPKGSKNKFTSLKDEYIKAFLDEDGIGGAEGIKKLLKNDRNKMMFLQMVSKMLPSNIDVGHSGQIDTKLTIEVVETK